MKRFHKRLATFVAVLIAAVGLAAAPASPAVAGEYLTTYIFGSSHPNYTLGVGYLMPGINGFMRVEDTYCDGDNGIIAAVYWRNWNEWKRTDLASVRGCDRSNINYLDAPLNASLRFRVCKLLPDGTWRDCIDKYTTND